MNSVINMLYKNSLDRTPFEDYTVDQQTQITHAAETIPTLIYNISPKQYNVAFIQYLFELPPFVSHFTADMIDDIAYGFAESGKKGGIRFIRDKVNDDLDFYRGAIDTQNVGLIRWLFANNFNRVSEEYLENREIMEEAVETENADVCQSVLDTGLFPLCSDAIFDLFENEKDRLKTDNRKFYMWLRNLVKD